MAHSQNTIGKRSGQAFIFIAENADHIQKIAPQSFHAFFIKWITYITMNLNSLYRYLINAWNFMT